MPHWRMPQTADEMNSDERLAWLLDHWYERLIQQEIDRVFQRLNYLLVASAFLLAGFIQIGSAEELTRIVLVSAGLLLSGAFYAMNCWNTRIIWAYSQWLRHGNKKHPQPVWIVASVDVPDLRRGFNEMKEAFDDILDPDAAEIVQAIMQDVFDVKRPAWFARYIPWVLFFVWFTLARLTYPNNFPALALWQYIESGPCFSSQASAILWLGLTACLLPTVPLVVTILLRLIGGILRLRGPA